MEDLPDPGTRPPPAAAPPTDEATAAGPGEPEAWAAVQAAWDDPAAHQAYLARFTDLDGLTTAGRRYRDVLQARPGDTVALAMKAEVVKRATVVGLAMLPRTPPPRVAPAGWRRVALLLLAAWLVSAGAWMTWKLFSGSPP